MRHSPSSGKPRSIAEESADENQKKSPDEAMSARAQVLGEATRRVQAKLSAWHRTGDRHHVPPSAALIQINFCSGPTSASAAA
jgi:hypothetical protein